MCFCFAWLTGFEHHFLAAVLSSQLSVGFILSRMNSIACTSSMSEMNLRRIQIFWRMSGLISSSSRRVPDLFRLMAG